MKHVMKITTKFSMWRRSGLLSVGVVVLILMCGPAFAGGEYEEDRPSITVTGMGQAGGAPDIALITVGVETTGVDVKAAVEDNREIMDRISSVLVELGVDESDMRTVNYGIYVDRSYQAPELSSMSRVGTAATAGAAGALPQGNVYRITSSVEVTVRDIDSLGSLLDASVEAGANQVWGIRFTVEDDRALLSKARELAVDDAFAKAEVLADFYGMILGPVLEIREGSGNPVIAPLRAEGLGGVSVHPGQSQITYTVQVTYALEME